MKSFKFVAALGLCAVVAAGSARADDSKGAKWNVHRQPTNQTQTTPQQRSGVLDHGRVHNGRPVVTNTTPANTPPGWEKGRKTGWGDCDVPPGQAKKVGCTPGAAHRRDHRWAQRRDRRWEDRRRDHRWEERREAGRREARRDHREARERAERRERRHERVEVARRHERH